MSMFGDIEPEDAWDADDHVADLVDNLRRRLLLVLALRQLSDPGQARLEMAVEDLAFVLGRIRDGLIERQA